MGVGDPYFKGQRFFDAPLSGDSFRDSAGSDWVLMSFLHPGDVNVIVGKIMTLRSQTGLFRIRSISSTYRGMELRECPRDERPDSEL